MDLYKELMKNGFRVMEVEFDREELAEQGDFLEYQSPSSKGTVFVLRVPDHIADYSTETNLYLSTLLNDSNDDLTESDLAELVNNEEFLEYFVEELKPLIKMFSDDKKRVLETSKYNFIIYKKLVELAQLTDDAFTVYPDFVNLARERAILKYTLWQSRASEMAKLLGCNENDETEKRLMPLEEIFEKKKDYDEVTMDFMKKVIRAKQLGLSHPIDELLIIGSTIYNSLSSQYKSLGLKGWVYNEGAQMCDLIKQKGNDYKKLILETNPNTIPQEVLDFLKLAEDYHIKIKLLLEVRKRLNTYLSEENYVSAVLGFEDEFNKEHEEVINLMEKHESLEGRLIIGSALDYSTNPEETMQIAGLSATVYSLSNAPGVEVMILEEQLTEGYAKKIDELINKKALPDDFEEHPIIDKIKAMKSFQRTLSGDDIFDCELTQGLMPFVNPVHWLIYEDGAEGFIESFRTEPSLIAKELMKKMRNYTHTQGMLIVKESDADKVFSELRDNNYSYISFCPETTPEPEF